MEMEKQIQILNIDDILPNRFQPRIKFNEQAINELSESIKLHGVIQPIVVRKISDKYEIIAGERRYKASVLAGKTTIPAIVTNLDDKNSAEVALIENVQRQNLSPIEEAISYKKILDMGYISQETLGEKLGKTQSTIANKLRLLNLNDEVQEALMENKISERHARSLLKLDNNQQVFMLNRIINERMTVRKTDEEIEKLLNKDYGSDFKIEEIEEIKGDNIMNNDVLKEFNIPTEPIIDTESTEILFEEDNNSDNNSQKIIENSNPGFMDIDKIEKEAIDISAPSTPTANIDELLKPSSEQQIQPIDQVQETVPEKKEEVKTGKFFNMFNFHAPNQDDDYITNLENETVNMDFDIPVINTPNIFEDPTSTQDNTSTNLFEQEISTENDVFSNDVSPSFSIADLPNEEFSHVTNQEEIKDEFSEFPTPVSPFNLTDESDFMNSTIENSINDSYRMNSNIEYENDNLKVDIPTQKYVTADLKTIINTIRDCASTIEKYGFKVETEELDLENLYQVTFKIDKNS